MALFAWFLVLVSVAVAGDRRSGSYAIDNGPEVSWAIDPSKFEVTLVSKRPVSWMSFGVSPTNGTMKGSDAFIAVGRAIYRVQLGPSGAEAGAFQTIAESYADGSIVQNGSNTIFNVRRPLDTDQPWQVAISQNQPVSLIVAWRDEPSPMGQLGIHSGHHSKLINNDTGALDREEAKVSRSDWYKQLRLPNTGLLVSYNIQGNKISFDIEANSETWIGIGWSERPSMHPSLAVIGQSPNQVEAFLINSDDVGAPDADLTSELSDTNFQSGNGKSRLQFTRPLQWSKSGTSRSFNIQVNGESTVIAATGSSTTMARHTETDIAQVSWSSGSTSSKGSAARAIAITHAVVMILAWLVLMPIAGIVARYFKDGEFRWILAHKALAICAVALTIVSFVLILWTHGRLFDSTHGLLGFFVVVLAVIQPVLAWFRNKARAIWRIQHRATAVILYLGALINCFLGAKLMYTTGTIFIALIVILLLIGLASIGFLEIKRGRASHQAERDLREEDRNRAQGLR